MNNNYTIILSSGEIYVLAGLLGYSSVFGVEDNTLYKWRNTLKQNVREVISRLEKRMIVLFELGGNICWQKSVDDIIHCICCPDNTSLVTYTSDSGRITDKWLFSKGENTVVMNQIASDAYKLELSDNAFKNAVSPVFRNSVFSEIHENIPFEKAECMRNEIDSFNRVTAEELAKEYISSENNLNVILDTLSGSCPFLSIQKYSRNEKYYKSGGHFILVRTGENVIRLKFDKENILHFDSVCEDEIIREFDSYD